MRRQLECHWELHSHWEVAQWEDVALTVASAHLSRSLHLPATLSPLTLTLPFTWEHLPLISIRLLLDHDFVQANWVSLLSFTTDRITLFRHKRQESFYLLVRHKLPKYWQTQNAKLWEQIWTRQWTLQVCVCFTVTETKPTLFLTNRLALCQRQRLLISYDSYL